MEETCPFQIRKAGGAANSHSYDQVEVSSESPVASHDAMLNCPR